MFITKVGTISFLCILYVLHWFWFYKFCEMVKVAIFTNVVEDNVNKVEGSEGKKVKTN